MDMKTPQRVFLVKDRKAVRVACGIAATYAVTAGGEIYVSGENTSGELGIRVNSADSAEVVITAPRAMSRFGDWDHKSIQVGSGPLSRHAVSFTGPAIEYAQGAVNVGLDLGTILET